MIDIIYEDLQKAFDTVLLKELIRKAKVHGITGNTQKWLENWLFDRKQRIVISGNKIILA